MTAKAFSIQLPNGHYVGGDMIMGQGYGTTNIPALACTFDPGQDVTFYLDRHPGAKIVPMPEFKARF